MTAKVIYPSFITRLDLPIERIIKGATKADLEHAVVIGWDKEGEFYFASTYASGPEVLWLLERAKKDLMNVVIPE